MNYPTYFLCHTASTQNTKVRGLHGEVCFVVLIVHQWLVENNRTGVLLPLYLAKKVIGLEKQTSGLETQEMASLWAMQPRPYLI